MRGWLMSKRLIRCLKPDRLSLEGVRLSLLLLFLTWLALAHGTHSHASSYRWSSVHSLSRREDSGPQSAPKITILKLGMPVESELSGGQRHSYQITVAEGRYVGVRLEPRGIDVTIQVFSPEGKLILDHPAF